MNQFTPHPTADPYVWLGRLEGFLCKRFDDTAIKHQMNYQAICEEIIDHVSTLVNTSPEKDEWDVAYFIWRILREWETDLSTLFDSTKPQSSSGFTVFVGKIEALRHLPRKSSVNPFDHAALCAGELVNTMRETLKLQTVSFKAVLAEQGVRKPLCRLPVSKEPARDDNSTPDHVDTWNSYLLHLEMDVAKLKKAVSAVKGQNMELAIKLAETQADLCEAKKALGFYKDN